jgi:hypothetical protein
MMTDEHLHQLEEDYEGALSALDDLEQQHSEISFERLRAQLDAIGTILTAYAVETDEPDEPLM